MHSSSALTEMLKKSRRSSTKVKKHPRHRFRYKLLFSVIAGLIFFSLISIYIVPNLFSVTSITSNKPPARTPGTIVRSTHVGPYLGINNGTGYNTDPPYVARSIKHTKDLSLGIVRMGIDGVGGKTEGATFDWVARDRTVREYLNAGIKIHAVVSPRLGVDRDRNYEQWQANFNYLVRNVMTHYKGKIFYYIIDNEPELDYGNGKMSAQECVDMTQIAFKAARAIDPKIKIESPPISGIESHILDEMLDRGIDKVSDYIGIHAYGGQIADNRLGHPWRVLEARGIRKPLAISEAGAISSWCPGSAAQKENCRRRWFAIFGQQLKRFGYDNALLFDLDGHDEWAIAPNFKPTKTYQQVKSMRLNQPLANKGFESANNHEAEWVHFGPGDIGDMGPLPYVTFVRNDPRGAHKGKGYLRLDSGRAKGGMPIQVRRIAGQLPPGKDVAIGAWAYVNGDAKATLKILGYDDRDGDAEMSKTTTKKNGWEYLEITLPISRYWAVVELGTTGTGKAGDYVKWDDVTLRTS
jgi:hypothetical protein